MLCFYSNHWFADVSIKAPGESFSSFFWVEVGKIKKGWRIPHISSSATSSSSFFAVTACISASFTRLSSRWGTGEKRQISQGGELGRNKHGTRTTTVKWFSLTRNLCPRNFYRFPLSPFCGTLKVRFTCCFVSQLSECQTPPLLVTSF